MPAVTAPTTSRQEMPYLRIKVREERYIRY
jgi:hypothetical protein